MSSSKTPATPDYTGAANATSAGNLDVARATATSNRPNYITPTGSQISTRNPNDPDQWNVIQTLSPNQQALFNQNERIQGEFGDLAEQGLARAGTTLGQGIDWNSLPRQTVDPGQTGQQALLARELPQLNADQDALESRLADQGIALGSKAYDSAMGGLARQKNDLYSQAALQGINVGNTARQQALQEQLTGQSNEINLLNALRTGNQVSVPQLQGFGQQANVSGPDQLAAQQSTYNANLGNANVQNAQNNANTQSAISLANMLYNWYS